MYTIKTLIFYLKSHAELRQINKNITHSMYTIKTLTLYLKSHAELRQILQYSRFYTNGPSQGKAAHDGNWKYLNQIFCLGPFCNVV